MSALLDFVVAVPAGFWAESATGARAELAALAEEFSACERRLGKRANAVVDAARYATLRSRLAQQAHRLRATGLPAAVGPAAASPLPETLVVATPAGTGALVEALREVDDPRAALVRVASQEGCGLLRGVYYDPTADPAAVTRTRLAAPPASSLATPALRVAPAGASHPDLKVALQARADRASVGGGPLHVGAMPHDVVTEVLHTCAHETGPRAALLVRHADGSMAEPFPIRMLSGSRDVDSARSYRVALMSMRHPGLDAIVDFAWFRNAEVSQARSHAESDRACTISSRRLLSELGSAGPLRIDLYHTGFLPAVLGFYRALAEYQSAGGRCVVRPLYFRGEDFVSGALWGLPAGPDGGA